MIWIWHEYDAAALAIFHGRFMALLTKQSSKQCRFMACSWHFPLKTFSKVARIGFIMFVSVYLSSAHFFFFWYYFHWWFFRFRLINFFWGFLWSKYRVIRNTQTTNPNPQLVFGWWYAKQKSRIHLGFKVKGINYIELYRTGPAQIM